VIARTLDLIAVFSNATTSAVDMDIAAMERAIVDRTGEVTAAMFPFAHNTATTTENVSAASATAELVTLGRTVPSAHAPTTAVVLDVVMRTSRASASLVGLVLTALSRPARRSALETVFATTVPASASLVSLACTAHCPPAHLRAPEMEFALLLAVK